MKHTVLGIKNQILDITETQKLSNNGQSMTTFELLYSVFYQFRQATFDNGGSLLDSSQFLLLFQLPQKTRLASKVVKINSK